MAYFGNLLRGYTQRYRTNLILFELNVQSVFRVLPELILIS